MAACSLLTPALAAQTNGFSFERISVAQGLSQSAVTDIRQDRLGFLWIGTHDGLNKYDGFTFETFRHDANDPLSISDNLISCIHEDRLGELWVGTMHRGLNRRMDGGSSFARLRHDPADPASLDSDEITCLGEDAAGTMWVGTMKGLNRWDRRRQVFQHVALTGHPAAGRGVVLVRTIVAARSGDLWVGTNAGLFRLSPEGTVRHFAPEPGRARNLSHNDVNRVSVTSSGEILVATAAGIDRLVNEAGEFSPADWTSAKAGEKDGPPVTDIFEDERGRLWVGTYGGGLVVVDPRTGTSWRLRHEANDPGSLSSDRVIRIRGDRSGIIWVGTESGGLSKFSPHRSKFRLYRQVAYNPRTLSHNNITALAQGPAGDVWVGTGGGGLNRMRVADGYFERFPDAGGDRSGVKGDFVSALCYGRDGTLWVGRQAQGLWRLARGQGRLEKVRPGEPRFEFLSQAVVTILYEDRGGALWVGTDGQGLFARYPSAGEKDWRQFRHDPAAPGSLAHDSVHGILEDGQGRLWVATSNGLDRLDKSAGAFHHYPHDPADARSLSHDWAWSLYEDSRGRLWVGTYGGGLNRFHPDTGTFSRFTEKHGLANDVIYGILEDDGGSLWLSTNKGLSHFDPERGTFRNYDAGDGLQSNEFNTNAFLRGRDGRLYFGGVNGLNSFVPGEVAANTRVPPLAFTSFKVFDQESGRWPLPDEGPGIVLSHRQNFFSFEFAVLDFTAPQKNTYAYKLEGLDREWIHSGSRRYAAYTNVPPGRYLFRVKGANNDGVWNESGISAPLTIVPPFRQRWWFKGGMALVAVGLLLAVAVFTRRYINLLKAKTKAESFAAVGRFASFFAHDLKSPLEGIHLIATEMRNMFPVEDARRSHLGHIIAGVERLRNLVQSALDFSRASKPRLEPTDLNGLLRRTAEEFQGQHPCEIDLRLEPRLPLVDLDPALMRRVVINLLENSYQARRDPLKIEVRTTAGENEVGIEVSDNGQGIDPGLMPALFEPFASSKGQGRGFGLAFVSETVRNHGGQVRVDSTPGVGTAFHLFLPRKRSGPR